MASERLMLRSDAEHENGPTCWCEPATWTALSPAGPVLLVCHQDRVARWLRQRTGERFVNGGGVFRADGG